MSIKNNAVVVKVVKGTDKNGKPTNADLMLIGTEEKIENRKALAFQGAKAADLLAILEDADATKDLVSKLRSMVAAHNADVQPTHTLQIGDRTYGLFGTRMIKVQQTRHLDGKDGAPTILYVKMRDNDPYADVLTPAHFGPNAVAVPVKEKPSVVKVARTSQAAQIAELTNMVAQLAAVVASTVKPAAGA